ncbi:MAG: hypothetical protein H6726_25665 [Sandaracinaceae bacterium]|nr:hypothetical protein [Myxococcales bacterium]MCB9661061.1 hypothetical protein [Sandaracinaceae bacterium]
MSFSAAIKNAQTSVPECVAVGYVDMTTGMLLDVTTVDSHPSEVLDLVAAATADLFQGPSVTAIEKLFRKSRGQVEDGHHYFQEMLIFSENLLHLFMRSTKDTSHAAVFVCRGSVNIGMALSKARAAMKVLQEAI